MVNGVWSEVPSEVQRLDIDELRHCLETHLLGVEDKLYYQPMVDSTNTIAMHFAHDRSDEGMVVLADSQTAGKGRQGRRWVDVFGCNILSSTLLRPVFPPHFLVMIASLAVVDAIAAVCGLTATIKWPNDVLIEDKKVAGILIETSHDRSSQLIAIVGIGINVNGQLSDVPVGNSLITALPASVESAANEKRKQSASYLPTATTLEAECGYVVGREMLIARLLQRLEQEYLVLQQEAVEVFSGDNPAARSLWSRWRSQLSTLGRPVVVRQGEQIVQGVAEDVDSDGELILRDHTGRLTRITWGDVGYQ
ncbi:MAG: biotin--[acetyl-CoA-carboxylase] ligase [Ktedonobacteraceae bacterium]